MSTPSTFDRNLLALSAHHPELGRLISRTAASRSVDLIESRSGLKVPVHRIGERSVKTHSTVDPQKEARRFFQSYGGSGYLVFLGLGGGFDAAALVW